MRRRYVPVKAIWRGEDDELGLRNGKEYEIVGYSKGFEAYGVVDETGIAYLYPVEDFDITEPLPEPPIRKEKHFDWNI